MNCIKIKISVYERLSKFIDYADNVENSIYFFVSKGNKDLTQYDIPDEFRMDFLNLLFDLKSKLNSEIAEI